MFYIQCHNLGSIFSSLHKWSLSKRSQLDSLNFAQRFFYRPAYSRGPEIMPNFLFLECTSLGIGDENICWCCLTVVSGQFSSLPSPNTYERCFHSGKRGKDSLTRDHSGHPLMQLESANSGQNIPSFDMI
jgi:hypothetical protein